MEAMRKYTLAVRDRVSPKEPFGLGLRLGHLAATTLMDPKRLRAFKSFLKKHNLYVFTLNGFPYGDFHHKRIKEKVYAPDWTKRSRLEYTLVLAEILAQLLPENTSGSISTVPGSYRAWIRSEAEKRQMIANLTACVARLAEIKKKTGKDLHLGLEPEPDCFIETAKETVTFMTEDLLSIGRTNLTEGYGFTRSEAEEAIRRHLGICFDTCHMSLQFENLADSINLLRDQGIRLSKIQLSAALRVPRVMAARERLRAFCDPVYLHQVKALGRDETVLSFGDLEEALSKETLLTRDVMEWRIHFHVPLFFRSEGGIASTSGDLTPAFFRAALDASCAHFEIETYTFHVLPEMLRERGIVQSITDEFKWVFDRFPQDPAV